MTKARDIADFKFENIVDTGTEGTKVASGTTAQRGSTAGQFRFNSSLGLAEYYDGTQFKSIDAPPTISSISPTTETDANANIVITGSNFQTGATVKFIGNDGTEYSSPSVTVNSTTQITATTPSSALTVANEPYDIKITNTSSLSATLADSLDAGSTPTWTTAAGNIGTVVEDEAMSTLTVAATDADGQSVTITSSDFSVTGLTFSSGSITGTPNVNDSYASGGVTHTFTGTASDGTNTTNRTFNILRKWRDGSTSDLAAASGVAIYDITGETVDRDCWIKPTGYTGSAIQCRVMFQNASFGRGATLIGVFADNHSGFRMSQVTAGTNTSSVKNYHDTVPSDSQTAILPKTFMNEMIKDASTNHTFGGYLSRENSSTAIAFQCRNKSENAKGTTGTSVDGFKYIYATGEANNSIDIRIQTFNDSNSITGYKTASFSWPSYTNYNSGRSGSDGANNYHYMPDDYFGGGEWMFRENDDDTPRDASNNGTMSMIFVW